MKFIIKVFLLAIEVMLYDIRQNLRIMMVR
jgi:hypothetical protein